MKFLIKNNSGDTIVEVLFSIMIISLILSGAFVTSNTSLLNIRAAQERAQALGVAQAQVETLRAEASKIFASGSNSAYLNRVNTFCFDSSNTLKSSASGNCTFCFDNNNNLLQTPGGSCSTANKFDVAIQTQGQTNSGSLPTNCKPPKNCISTYKFMTKITWSSISPNTSYNSTTLGKTNITLFYRLSIQ